MSEGPFQNEGKTIRKVSDENVVIKQALWLFNQKILWNYLKTMGAFSKKYYKGFPHISLLAGIISNKV